MQEPRIPAPIARIVLTALPSATLQKSIDALIARMKRNRPSLFRNLGNLTSASILIEPRDVPHKFVLSYGGEEEASLKIFESKSRRMSASIKGNLKELLDLLEGRSDGDTMFFSRGIEITGNTSAVVALRNTIDREDINLIDDVTKVLGPFAKPVKYAMVIADNVAQSVKNRISAACKEAVMEGTTCECDDLRKEIDDLKSRLNALEKEPQTTKPVQRR